jgi:hypothetical protein
VVGIEHFGQFDATFEHFVLLIEGEIGVELIALRAVFGLGRARPISFEKRTGDISDAQLVLFQDAFCFADFFCIESEQVFVPHSAQLDPAHTKFTRSHFAGMAEILADLVIDYGDFERRA